ncbi:Beta-glucoside kinase, partial [termite gut metagenome]
MKNYIVIDMGGTRLKIGFFRNTQLMKCNVVSSCAQENFENTLRIFDAEIKALIELQNASSIAGIGLSMPGIIDTKDNKILSINDKYSDAVSFDLNSWAKEHWN